MNGLQPGVIWDLPGCTNPTVWPFLPGSCIFSCHVMRTLTDMRFFRTVKRLSQSCGVNIFKATPRPVNTSFGCCGNGDLTATVSMGWFCSTTPVLAFEALIWVAHSSRWCILMCPNLRNIICHFTQRKQPSAETSPRGPKKQQNKIFELFLHNEFTCRWLQRLGRNNRD